MYTGNGYIPCQGKAPTPTDCDYPPYVGGGAETPTQHRGRIVQNQAYTLSNICHQIYTYLMIFQLLVYFCYDV